MSPRRLKDGVLERYLADALPPARKAEVEALLDQSPKDRARVDELRADGQAFLLQHPPGPLVARLEAKRSKPFWRWPALLVPAAAACLAVVLWVRGVEPDSSVKGSVALTLHRKTGETSEPVRPGQALAPGDALRFEVRAPSRGFVAIVSRDGQGAVSVYHPHGGLAAQAYDPAVPLLPAAVALDEALGPERIWVLFGPDRFELSPILEALRAGKPIDAAAPGLAADEVQILKR